MPVPQHVIRFWRALDDRLASVRATPWGAVVTDARFPAIWDANYARLDVPLEGITLDLVAEPLLAALDLAGAEKAHLVLFHPEVHADVLVATSTLGHKISWDLVMEIDPRAVPHNGPGPEVVELRTGPALWSRVEQSIELFGVQDAAAVTQLRRIEEEVQGPRGKRWFGVFDADRIVSLGALVLLEGVGYVDNVATFPEARGQGYASAIVTRVVERALSAGASHICLFADPGADAVVRMYERLGFRGVGRVASTLGGADDLRHASARQTR